MGLIKSFDYDKEHFGLIGTYKYGKNWPVVYVLEGGKEAYIGETINVYKRSQQHFIRPERKNLNHIHIITDTEFNKSAALDIESLLIQYMAADNQYVLQNGNEGLTDHDYFEKALYRAKFEQIWKVLQQKKIVLHGLFELRNSDLFKYSPYKALNTEQLALVETITESIQSENMSRHLIQGEPGTGKTIVAIYLMKYLVECEATKDLKVGLVVPMTSLRSTLKKVFKSVQGLKSSMILSPFDVVKENYDVLIVDEAHRLNRRVNISNMGAFDNVNRQLGLPINEGDQVDWLVRSTRHLIMCYDKHQSVRPSDVLPDKIDALQATSHPLTSQMRVIGGEDYIAYIERVLHQEQSKPQSFKGYTLNLVEDMQALDKIIKYQDNKYHLSRLVAGYAWPWVSKKDKSAYDILLDGKAYKWNGTKQDWINSPDAINEIGCIHTTQGYDLNYVGVIIGHELVYRDGELCVIKENYHDKYGKQTVEDPEVLKAYILNIYKTLLTRGIRGTYVYVCDEALRSYLKQFIPTYESICSMEDMPLLVAEESTTYGIK